MWETIIGHYPNITMLQKMLSNGRLPHAMLFVGPSGIGKALTAKALAASLLCGGTSPCGRCLSCQALEHQNHANMITVVPDGARIKIDQIRAIQHEIAMRSSSGKARVCIIEDAGKMTKEAGNSLLKMLEEPPEDFHFILIASSIHAVLNTILSRCLVMKFLPLVPGQMVEALTKRGFAQEQAAVAARLSGGRLGKALNLLAPEGLKLRDEALRLAVTITEQTGIWFFSAIGALDKRENAELGQLLGFLSGVFRDLTILRTAGNRDLVFNVDKAEQLQDLALKWSDKMLIAAVRRIYSAERAIAANGNMRLTWEALLIELADLAKEGENDANCCRYTV